MRRSILFSLICCTTLAHTQPKLVGTLSYSGQQEGGALFRLNMPGSSPGVIHTFNISAHKPVGGVVAGDANWLYGNLNYNDTSRYGAFYKIQRDGTGYTKLYDYTSGFEPSMIPFFHTDGMIYFCDGPAIKKYNPSTGTFTSLPVSGFSPARNLLIDADDWMYFTEQQFSQQLIKMKTDGSQETPLHTFNDATEGYYGVSGVTETAGDTLFGVQSSGGISNGGTLYSIKKDGSGFVVHHQFSTSTGTYPISKLVYFDGKLFGTTMLGGNFNHGVLYAVNPDGSNYRVLYHFDGGNFGDANVIGNISVSSNGRIFGSFSQFYNNPGYRLFKIDTSGANFEPFFSVDQNANGNSNQDILLLNDESIFLTTAEMGLHDGGVLNQCDTAGTGSGLYHFGYSANGFRPAAGLIKGTDGKLYGTTTIGGITGNGVVFSINADGTSYTKLHEFTNAQGREPSGRLLEASDGKLYGTCRWGGPTNSGCIYRMDKNGSNFDTVYTFYDFGAGYSPTGSLIEDNSGILYGTTFYGPGSGGVFKINKNGSNYSFLKSFLGAADLAYPYNGLTRSGNYLYGSCGYGGLENKGGTFRIKTDGSGYQVLHEFTTATGGELPAATPIVASNGKLYGTAAYGGTGDGLVYSMDTTGANYTVLRNFSFAIDGSSPWSGLIQASDGWLYGTTTNSNITSGLFGGTLYKLNPDGSGFTLIKEFDYTTEGQSPNLLLDLNGNFVLPVNWLVFNATQRDQTIQLTWKTAQEQNSNRFEVERSANGITFNKIGTVAAAGNTSSITSYSFTDEHPLDGMNYYRLKQVDDDGKYDFSKVVSVNRQKGNKIVIAPNPVNGQLTIRLPSAGYYTSVSIADASGKLVMQKTINGSASQLELDVHHLLSGWYLLQLTGKDTRQQAFLKQ